MGKECQGQNMGGRKSQLSLRDRSHLLYMDARMVQLAKQVAGQGQECLSGRRQLECMCASIDQRDAYPVLKRLDSPTEARLRDEPLLRGTREAPDL